MLTLELRWAFARQQQRPLEEEEEQWWAALEPQAWNL